MEAVVDVHDLKKVYAGGTEAISCQLATHG
jgi:hypothetical protein